MMARDTVDTDLACVEILWQCRRGRSWKILDSCFDSWDKKERIQKFNVEKKDKENVEYLEINFF